MQIRPIKVQCWLQDCCKLIQRKKQDVTRNQKPTLEVSRHAYHACLAPSTQTKEQRQMLQDHEPYFSNSTALFLLEWLVTFTKKTPTSVQKSSHSRLGQAHT
ncbi:hypothetical protein M758_10G002700 [Ceratodon purpureus]|uniref:Uncharacterized protein n=1 Tax=Ceratodon purpureus TaxID=3225 RepID=A0A8T0GGE2_CERPU|nr:hypothetical protein KC19_10G003400 [Ceratodon purpureus]KAG0602261.1 hypothetical protein M758_10G002700 [Ceratodon purpureus]